MTATLFGPRPGEPPARDLGTFRSVAVLSDVHGNVPALRAVLAEPDVVNAELVVFCGDLTWGPEPDLTVEILLGLGARAVFVRGNAERAVTELASGVREATRPRESWMLEQHAARSRELVAGFPLNVVAEVVGLGRVRFGHGSPRSDTELITPATPLARLAEIAALMPEPILVSGHTHLQFDRVTEALHSVNPGSVGLPYHEGPPGTAYWAMLGPAIDLRATRYDVDEEVARCREVHDPRAEDIVAMLLRPPTPAEIEADAESLVFSD